LIGRNIGKSLEFILNCIEKHISNEYMDDLLWTSITFDYMCN